MRPELIKKAESQKGCSAVQDKLHDDNNKKLGGRLYC